MSENASPLITLTVLFAHMTRYFMAADLLAFARTPMSGTLHDAANRAASLKWCKIAEGDTDTEPLAHLMLDSYHGTIDDQGETIIEARSEVAKLFANEYGVFDRDTSIVCEAADHLASATIITRIRNIPFVAFSMTAPSHKRQGLARAGLTRVMKSLAERREHKLRLMVTKGNTPAETLYTSLGFVAE